MADITVVVNESLVGGRTLTDAAAALNDTYYLPNDGKTALLVRNRHATGTLTLTLETPASFGGLALADRTVSVSASEDEKLIGPFPPSLYNDPATGQLKITLAGSGGLAIGDIDLIAVSIPQA